MCRAVCHIDLDEYLRDDKKSAPPDGALKDSDCCACVVLVLFMSCCVSYRLGRVSEGRQAISAS
jgi:hypothetical protein